jgi:type II secretory pathway component PulC
MNKPDPRKSPGTKPTAVFKNDRSRLLRAAVVAALSAAIVAQLFYATTTYRRDLHAATAASRELRSSSGTANPSGQRQLDMGRLIAAHLFGAPETAPEAASPTANWVLSGTLQGPTPESGMAIIGLNSAPTSLRAVGEDIAAGFKLAKVYVDFVILQSATQSMTVSMPKLASRAAGGEAPRVAAAAGVAELAKPDRPQPRLPAALAVLFPKPYFDADSHYAGMMVWGAGKGATLANLGLRRGDVITQFEGKPLNNSSLAQGLLERMSSGTPVNVTVLRDGALMNMSLTMISPRR